MTEHDRNRRTSRTHRLAATIAAGALVALTGPLTGVLPATGPSPITPPTARAEIPQRFDGRIWDAADVLTDADEATINERAAQLQQDQGTVMRIIYVNTFDGIQAEEWAHQTWQALGGTPNLAVFAVAVGDRNVGAYAGNDVDATGPDLANSAVPQLGNDDWAGAALAAIDEATAPGATEGLAVLGAGAAGAAALGGGAVAWSRRNKKKRTATEVEQGKKLNPDDIESHDQLSTDALDQLAREELVSTDESIRLATTELDLARAEFGDARVRDLTQALDHSQRTLNRAFRLRQSIDDAPSLPETERRGTLLEIISTCGTADDRLDGEVARYAEMREQLLNAPDTLDRLTQRGIALRTRIPNAATILDGLRARYDEEALASISDNVDMATEHVNMAERSGDEARSLLTKPAGEQAGLVDALRATDLALDQAEKLVEAIEHADDNIAQALTGLKDLINEVRDEIAEATNLLAAPDAANIDRNALADAADSGRTALDIAQAKSSTDPLGAWTILTDADATLDDQLEEARDAANAFARKMQTLHNALTDARAQVTAARDIIGTRRSIVGSTARTRLAEAERHLATAENIAANPGNDPDHHPRRGIQEARTAAQLGRQAAQKARDDINRHRQRMNQHRGGGNSGAMIAGMVLGSMMNSGGGFSGGGSFGGGGFSGGGSFGGGSGGSASF
ncbi:TPM domain-containing protein [Corynebacterium freneyi]|uniref:TPM domain-containing protein n=1 Tax=Corynebacterium freneyi TaxID=134034 RepID=UPI001EF2AEF8|nr:TPM domain-containing protein [Corynebacterium freneyi]MCG7440067.1 TPM domain-containing protein [Corynebacterium freneyi]